MAKETIDPTMMNVAKLFEESGKSLAQLGEAMGYSSDIAKKAAWQFLHKTNDPRLSMLRRFAKAMNVSLEELVTHKRRS
jgi:transcriptional regulator with XRE-family HTH domain